MASELRMSMQSSTQDRQNMIKTAMKVIGKTVYPSLQNTYETVVVRQTHRILKDPTNILLPEYQLLPSGRRYRACKVQSQ